MRCEAVDSGIPCPRPATLSLGMRCVDCNHGRIYSLCDEHYAFVIKNAVDCATCIEKTGALSTCRLSEPVSL